MIHFFITRGEIFSNKEAITKRWQIPSLPCGLNNFSIMYNLSLFIIPMSFNSPMIILIVFIEHHWHPIQVMKDSFNLVKGVFLLKLFMAAFPSRIKVISLPWLHISNSNIFLILRIYPTIGWWLYIILKNCIPYSYITLIIASGKFVHKRKQVQHFFSLSDWATSCAVVVAVVVGCGLTGTLLK